SREAEDSDARASGRSERIAGYGPRITATSGAHRAIQGRGRPSRTSAQGPRPDLGEGTPSRSRRARNPPAARGSLSTVAFRAVRLRPEKPDYNESTPGRPDQRPNRTRSSVPGSLDDASQVASGRPFRRGQNGDGPLLSAGAPREDAGMSEHRIRLRGGWEARA